MRALVLFAAVATVGCFVPRDTEPRADRTCTHCHGDSARETSNLLKAAPPSDTFGNTEQRFPSVGAHALHLTANARHEIVSCSECHRVPTDPNDDGHNDGVTQIVFGPIAKGDGGQPKYDPASRTCTNSGCHGAVSGVWTRPRLDEQLCGTCHSLPPPAPHPRAGSCAACHGEVVGAGNVITVPALHVNGVVDVVEASCNACHGSTDGGAPPRAVDGGTERTHPGVGAHTAHLSGGTASKPVACDACHLVPQRAVTMSHPNGGPAEVLSTVGWNRTSEQCTNACHGLPDAGGGTSPRWTALDAGVGCSSCHAAPPPAPHPSVSRCALCHPSETDGTPSRTSHVNGRLDVTQPVLCNACHGSSTNEAPPRDLSGSQDTTRIGVGAHQSHLVGRGMARRVACDECHVIPATVVAPGHLNGVNDIRFQGVARANQAVPSYTQPTCRNTACHDISNYTVTPGGGTATAPSWTVVDGSQRQCTSCHAMPPPMPHVARQDCWACHLNAAPDGGFVRADLHVNGRVDFFLQ